MEAGQGSGSHSKSPGYEYEVFLSFRGIDTRHGFTDCLYRALYEEARIRTFRDDEELRTGEEIGTLLFKAIEESKISIPIFSKNYASSKWCLKELTRMLEQKKIRNHMILPVFYDVTPAEVQDHTQYYGSALQEHEAKYGPEIVQYWRETLSEVGRLKGLDLINSANGYEGKFIKLIVSNVINKLKKAQLIVTDNLVGTDDQVKALEQLLDLTSPDVKIIGLWGMGGIGKTTLSKIIYNKIWNEFEGYSFNEDIRETASQQSKGLKHVQRSLVEDLSKYDPQFKRVDEGIIVLKDKYQRKKVLIILDDIDDTNQLKALAVERNSYGPGSRIIITSRNRDVFERYHRMDHIYEVAALNSFNANKLFCMHAFRKDIPTEELCSVSREIVKTAGGLPLTLEVIGSSLSAKKRNIWEETAEKLKTILDKDVRKKLRISFDGLEKEEQQIFLDIACFFIGEDKINAFPMWKDLDLYPEIGIDVLVSQSLIKIEENNKIWMHNQLRDLGRVIVRRENNGVLRMCSRLWRINDVERVLTNPGGSLDVLKAIRVYPVDKKNNLPLTREHFINLPELRFLDLDDTVELAGDFKNLLTSLLWFRWRSCSVGSSFNLFWLFPLGRSLNNFCLPNLVYLELQENNLTDADWKDGLGSVKMIKLKILDLTYSEKLKRTPKFSAFPNLERLILLGCTKLEVIDPSIGELTELTYLDISLCKEITKLPHEVGSLKKLEFLDASSCEKLTQIPSSVVPHLFHLQTLYLHRCIRLSTFCALPDRSLPSEHYARLIKLDISECMEIKTLSVSHLKLLETLDASQCKNLEEIVGLDQLCALQSLDITKCCSIKSIPDLSKLQKLEALYARDCHKLQELVGLDELTSLKRLRIAKCKELKELPHLSKLKKLEELYAYGCQKLQEIVGLGELNALKFVHVSLCKEIRQLPDLSMLNKLKALSVVGCEKLWELAGLGKLIALEELYISGCVEIEKLPDMSKLNQLQRLHAMRCTKLRKLPGILFLEKLMSLKICGSRQIENLPELKRLGLLSNISDACSSVSMEELINAEKESWQAIEDEQDNGKETYLYKRQLRSGGKARAPQQGGDPKPHPQARFPNSNNRPERLSHNINNDFQSSWHRDATTPPLGMQMPSSHSDFGHRQRETMHNADPLRSQIHHMYQSGQHHELRSHPKTAEFLRNPSFNQPSRPSDFGMGRGRI